MHELIGGFSSHNQNFFFSETLETLLPCKDRFEVYRRVIENYFTGYRELSNIQRQRQQLEPKRNTSKSIPKSYAWKNQLAPWAH